MSRQTNLQYSTCDGDQIKFRTNKKAHFSNTYIFRVTFGEEPKM